MSETKTDAKTQVQTQKKARKVKRVKRTAMWHCHQLVKRFNCEEDGNFAKITKCVVHRPLLSTKAGFFTADVSALINPHREHIFSLPLIHRPSIGILMGRECFSPRDVQFFSDESKGYYFSAKLSPSVPLTKPLREILKVVNDLFGTRYNGILINKYPDGESTIGKHSDDETELTPIGSRGVVGIVLGATRKFRLRKKGKGAKIKGKNFYDVPVPDGHLLWMAGDFQQHYTHEIPKEKRVREERISLTFRRHTE
jgi:alkylated DNA repair dioxygenase AlkB